jgi:hypothetical protein
MLSEDKVSHLSHVILSAVKKSPLVQVKSEDARILKEIKRVLASELAQEQEIDRKVRAKLGSCCIARRLRKSRGSRQNDGLVVARRNK